MHRILRDVVDYGAARGVEAGGGQGDLHRPAGRVRRFEGRCGIEDLQRLVAQVDVLDGSCAG